MEIPIIDLQLQGFRERIMVALLNHSEQLNRIVQDQVDKICTVEFFEKVIKEKAIKEIEGEIAEQVRKFYRYGRGKEVIKKSVDAILNDEAAFHEEMEKGKS